MNTFERLRAAFDADWTTVLVGWNGLGVLSWPDRWTESPPLISREEIAAYAEERLSSCSDPALQDSLVTLVSPELQCQIREEIRDLLQRLSKLDGGDPQIELRKWRLILLEDVLARMPKDVVHGLIALTEFWQDFGFPSDSPHEVQGRGNTITPSEYYREENLQRLIDRHRTWIENERISLRKQRAV